MTGVYVIGILVGFVISFYILYGFVLLKRKASIHFKRIGIGKVFNSERYYIVSYKGFDLFLIQN